MPLSISTFHTSCHSKIEGLPNILKTLVLAFLGFAANHATRAGEKHEEGTLRVQNTSCQRTNRSAPLFAECLTA
ncbi:hypothetical protein IQ07DRAFT_587453 [Pyrenochaeta sp. DS3sAY3a]|nr:hypothetical protein IQ07DRAFT_587453 [Pyrenochaeta sp. DS3sAY3a]